MASLLLIVNALHKAEMEYHGHFGHTLVRIKHIAVISRIDICCEKFSLETQTVSPTIPGFQVIKRCVQYMDSHPHKPIFYPSNYYYGSNDIRLTWSGNQVEYYTTQSVLEFHQDADHARILNRRQSFSVILHTLLGIAIF